MQFFRSVVNLLILCCFVAACSSVPETQIPLPDKTDQLVSRDLVDVLNQVDELNPKSTTVLIPGKVDRSSGFASALYQALRHAGYAITINDGNRESKPVYFHIDQRIDPSHGPVATYVVSMGGVSVRRTYRIDSDGWIRPINAMQIKGADAAGLSINDQIFIQSDKPAETIDASDDVNPPNFDQDRPQQWPEQPDVAPATEVPETMAHLAPDMSLPQPSVRVPAGYEDAPFAASGAQRLTQRTKPLSNAADQIHTNAGLASATAARIREQGGGTAPHQLASQSSSVSKRRRPRLLELVAPALATVVVEHGVSSQSEPFDANNLVNVRELGKSNFEQLLVGYGSVAESILTFSNDSTRLGSVNKTKLQQLAANFDASTDVFSVIGCSHGKTAVSGGQQELALGRAQRVAEELRFAGVPRDRILNEGCWATDQYDRRMPRRGVVVEHKRLGQAKSIN